MGMTELNRRNKQANLAGALNDPTGGAAAVAAAAASKAGSDAVDVFSRRQTRSRVYWRTDKGGAAGGEGEQAAQQAAQPAAAANGDGATPPPEGRTPPPPAMAAPQEQQLKALSLDLDLSRLAEGAGGAGARRMARRMLGPKWADSLAMDLAGKSVLSFGDWKQRMGLAGNR